MLVSDFDFALPDDLIAQTAAPRGRIPPARARSGDRRDGPPLDWRPANDSPAGRCSGRQQHSCLCGPTAGSSGAQRWGSGVPTTEIARDRAPSFQLPASAQSSVASPTPADDVGPPERWSGRPSCTQARSSSRGRSSGSTVPLASLMGEVLERHFQGRRTIRLWPESGGDVTTLIDALGHVPLPPYIRRDDTAGGPRALPDRLCARARVGCRADRRAALHDRFARGAQRARHRARGDHAARRATARSSRSKSIRSKITSSIPNRIRLARTRLRRSIAPDRRAVA